MSGYKPLSSPDDFHVVITASGRSQINQSGVVDSASSTNGSFRLVHAVTVTQPVQSWTVIRDHIDFVALGNVLSSAIAHNLPTCPTIGNNLDSISTSHQNMDHQREVIIHARNAVNNWLIDVLRLPGVRESPVIRQFLCYGANIIPPQFENVSWIHFDSTSTNNNTNNPNSPSAANANHNNLMLHSTNNITSVDHHHQQQQHHNRNKSSSGNDGSVDELEMEFGYADGPTGANSDHDDDCDDDDDDDSEDDHDYFSATERYQPTEEAMTEDDVLEFKNNADDVEMIEDVGSLAQSLGASHLGRSLQLQAQLAARQQQQQQQPHNPLLGKGLTTTSLTSSSTCKTSTTNIIQESLTSGSTTGIGNAIRSADLENSQSSIAGLSDSFYQKKPVSAPRLDSFKMIKVIGKGSFGKVFLVQELQTGDMFALKVLRKDNIIKRNQVEHTKTERSVLGYVNHPFIVGLKMAFQSKDKLYFVLDYCAGGELFFHLSKVGKFTEPRAAFYAAEIVLALAYVHELDIVYRDLKPENVLLDARGHVRLTDFGLSKEGITNSSSGATSFCGTPEYLAPEILNRQGHGRAVDWWSLGALLYEMLTGLPPFYCRDREKLFEKIRKGHLEYPRSLSARAQALLRGLLMKDPRRRLGSGEEDAEAIKQHAFFAEIDWIGLSKGEVSPPWDPQISGQLDTSQFDDEFTSMPIFSPSSYQPPHGFGATPQDNIFEGFTFTDQRFYGPQHG